MMGYDLLFVWLVKFVAVSFLLLGTGYFLLRVVRQPVERISLIQITLASVVVAAIMSLGGWLPETNLDLIPVAQVVEPIETSSQEPVSVSSTATMATNTAIENSALSPNRIPRILGAADSTAEVVPLSSGHDSVRAETESLPKSDAAAPGALPLSAWKIGQQVLLIAVATISAIQLLFLFLGFRITKSLIRNAEIIPDHDLVRVRALLSEIADVGVCHVSVKSSRTAKIPMVYGMFRPTILLPAELVGPEADQLQLRHCLAHEWMHLARRDLVTWSLTSLLQAALWMQPFYWLLRRELRVSQDQVADQFAARITSQHAEYAATLVEFSKSNHPVMLGALTMAGTKSNLYRRVEMLLNDRFQFLGVSRRKVVAGFIVLMAVGSLMLASMQLAKASSSSPTSDNPVVLDQDKSDSKQDDDAKKSEKKDEPKATEPAKHGGVILDQETNQPIKGAIVTVKRQSTKAGARMTHDETKHTTNEDGVYEFEIPVDQLNDRYLYIELDVEHETHAPKQGFGYAYSMIKKNLELGENPFFNEVHLSPGEAVEGRVVNGDGEPLADVKIIGYSAPAPTEENPMGFGSFVKAKTDANGKFKINFSKGGDSVLWVQPDDLAMRQLITGVNRGDLGDIMCGKGIQIRGQVLDARGNPVVGAWVEADDQDAQSEIQMPVASSMSRRAKTDENGKYELSPMRASNYQLKVRDSGPATDENGFETWKKVKLPGVFIPQSMAIDEDSAKREFNIQAVPHVYIRGQFVNSKDEPTGGHMPHLFGKVNGNYMSAEGERGENKGEFFVMVPHGMEDARISFMTNEHSALKLKIGDGKFTPDRNNVELGTLEEDLDEIKIIRYVAPILQIKVVDEEGNDIPKAMVGAIYSDPDVEVHHLVKGIKTTVFFEQQKDGYHRSSSLCPDSEFEYFAKLQGYERASAKLTMAEKETKQVTLTMKKSDGHANNPTDAEMKMKEKDK